MKDFKHRYAINVLLPDRVGILRDVTTALTELGANIDAISQTVVEGYFTVILTASFRRSQAPEAVRAALERNFRDDDAAVTVMSYRQAAPGRRPAADAGEHYICTLTGRDRPAILKTITTFLAEKDINIEDWFVQFSGGQVTHIGEITVPARLDIKQVQAEFRRRLAPLGLSLSLQHENLFRVTNEVGAVQSLMRGKSHA